MSGYSGDIDRLIIKIKPFPYELRGCGCTRGFAILDFFNRISDKHQRKRAMFVLAGIVDDLDVDEFSLNFGDEETYSIIDARIDGETVLGYK